MRKLGLIGGMSWVSTRDYYELINRGVQRKLSPEASAPLLIESLDFANLRAIADDAGWDHAGEVLSESARRLVAAGAGALLICANSMHKVYDRVAQAAGVPVFHIADCVGREMKAAGRFGKSSTSPTDLGSLGENNLGGRQTGTFPQRGGYPAPS